MPEQPLSQYEGVVRVDDSGVGFFRIEWYSWLARLVESLGGTIGLLTASYTVAALPSPATPGRMIYVSDESGGAVLAFSDGTNWRRVTDRAIVS